MIDHTASSQSNRGHASRTVTRNLSLDPRARRADGFYSKHGKRCFDLAATLLILPIALPFIVGVAVFVRLMMGEGVLLRQARVGRNGETFSMYKFRTMQPSRRRDHRPFDGHDRRRTHKDPNDPRHTPAGKRLRETSLDEFPQLFNVLRGEMSLVGPRPELADVVDRYDLRGHPRHCVTPGITGIWQITMRNEGALLHECFDADLEYTTSVRFRTDLRILLRTVKVLVAARGR